MFKITTMGVHLFVANCLFKFVDNKLIISAIRLNT